MDIIAQSGSPAKGNNTLLSKNSALTSCHSANTHPVLSQHNVSANDSDPDDEYTIPSNFADMFAATKKKYKPVTLKVKSHIGLLPDKFRIICNIIGNPLKNMPVLCPHPLNPGFLLPDEHSLLHHFMMLHKDAFAWEVSEHGHF